MEQRDEKRSLAKDQMENPERQTASNSLPVCSVSNTGSSPLSGGIGGIDTVSFTFRFPEPEEGIFLDAFDVIESRVNWSAREIKTVMGYGKLSGKMRESLRLIDLNLPGGVTFGFTPKSRSFWVEGRLAAMLSGSSKDLNLYPMDFLRIAASRCASDVADLFEIQDDLSPLPWNLGAVVSLRRLDVTTEISSPASYGLQLLRGFANLSMAGDRPINIWLKEKRVETISLYERGKKKRRIRFRIYDKGSQTGSHRPGERIRFERQLRWTGKKQPVLSSVGLDDARRWWREGYEPWLGKDLNEHGLRMMPFERASEQILKRAEAGSLDWKKAEMLIGALVICLMRGENWWKDEGHRDAGYRRFRELRQLGIALAPGSVEVNVGDALQVAEESISSAPVSLPDLAKRRGVEPEEWRLEAKRQLQQVVAEHEEKKKEEEKRKREAA